MKRNDVPLVLLAGLLCDETIWAEVRTLLVDIVDITIIAFAGFSSIGDMADHVLATAPARFALAGHSMGGRVALEVIRRAPERVTALALFNTGVSARATHEEESRGRLVRLAQDEGMARLAAEWLPPMVCGFTARSEALMNRLSAMVERNTAASFAGQIRALLDRPDASSVLPLIRAPTLLASGTQDGWSPLPQHEAMMRAVSHARLVAIEDAGHMSPFEQPQAVADALRDWLHWAEQEVDPGSSLSDIDRMLIEHACERQIFRYAALTDAGDFQSVAALYTEGASYARPSDPNTVILGRSAILAEFSARPPRFGRHVVSNVVVDVLGNRTARAHSSVVLLLADASVAPARLQTTLVGAFDDRFEKCGDQWLFAARHGSIAIRHRCGNDPAP